MEGLVLLLILLALWGAVGIWGAWIMQDKGRSSAGGFILGVTLGPVGIILAMLMSPSADHLAHRLAIHSHPSQEQRSLRGVQGSLRAAQGIGWYCERCGTTFDDTLNAFESFKQHDCPEANPDSNRPDLRPTVNPAEETNEDMTEPDLPPTEMVQQLIALNGTACQGCDREFDDPLYLGLSHNTPRSDGGLNHISNRLLLCGPCNRIKSNTLTLSGLRAENQKRGRMA